LSKPKKVFPTIFNTYKEISVIGEGGSGIVYQAVDEDNARYAIKMLKDTANKEKKARFKNELHFQLKIGHPNIIPVTDYGLFQEGELQLPFYVMPYYDKSLRALIQDGIKANDAEKYISDILDGVEAAHKLRIIHRDLKPENILYDKQTNRLLIADFGIARFEEENLYTAVQTKDTTRLANFRYSAPEQRDPRKHGLIDEKSDIYAIGLIMNELFTGDVPQGVDYNTISQCNSDYGFLDEIIQKMIMQDPTRRYKNIEAVKVDLIGNKLRFIEQQQLVKLKSKIIRLSEIDDDLINDPPRIIAANWQNGLLKMRLSQKVNANWIESLNNMGSYSFPMNLPPSVFNFDGDTVSVRVQEYDAQQAIDYFKKWLPTTNQIYKRRIESEREAEISRQRKVKEAEIAKKELELRVNAQLKI
jgi:serine/threonine protein kinase